MTNILERTLLGTYGHIFNSGKMLFDVLTFLLLPVLGLAASLADLVQPGNVGTTSGQERPPRPTTAPKTGNYIKAAVRKERVEITNNVTSNGTTAAALARRWGRLPLSLYEGGIVYLMDGKSQPASLSRNMTRDMRCNRKKRLTDNPQ